MTDTQTHPGVRQAWKSVRDPKTVSNSPRTSQNRPKIRGLMTDMETHPGGHQTGKSIRDPKKGRNNARNWPKSAKTAGVDDRHVNAPRGSSIVEITPGPQNRE